MRTAENEQLRLEVLLGELKTRLNARTGNCHTLVEDQNTDPGRVPTETLCYLYAMDNTDQPAVPAIFPMAETVKHPFMDDDECNNHSVSYKRKFNCANKNKHTSHVSSKEFKCLCNLAKHEKT